MPTSPWRRPPCFGEGFAKAITLFVIFSVMGTVNGLVMGYIRMPYSMALRPGMVPGSPLLRRLHPRLGVPVYSSLVCFALCLFWMAVHYVTTRYGLLPNSDVSEIAIAVSYLFYVRLYWQIYRMHRKGQIPGRWKGVWVPLLATCGAAIILSGGCRTGCSSSTPPCAWPWSWPPWPTTAAKER